MTMYYKNLKATAQVNGNDQGGSSVKWTLEYEKENENIPAPIKYLELMPVITKNIDTYLTKNA
ncbi:Bet v I/Major latex protein [Trema orientale]|uniref:Bet v I/Major latex protein n=1 Tax=Trema orientale TaxID=63057 RepID=A0A2P5F9J5_TREOI|nr:Bet v I/Major latex protein [Trema orientale]